MATQAAMKRAANKYRASAKGRAAAYRANHSAKGYARQLRYRRRHAKRIRANSTAWFRRAYRANPEVFRNRSSNYSRRAYKNNPEPYKARARRWRKQHPRKKLRMDRKWRANNRELANRIFNAAVHRRNARKRGNGGSWTAAEWLALKAKHGHKCLGCGKSERHLKRLGRKLVPDHVLPLAKKGPNEITNLQPLCHGRGGCNNYKGTKHIDYR